MIPEERAVELVESLLADQRLAWPRKGPVPDLVVRHVEEFAVGWLVRWSTAACDRPGAEHRGVMGGSHYLVDRHDGSIHHVPAAWWQDEGRQEDYLLQTRGTRPPDPPAASVRALAHSAGLVAAMSHLRKQAPRLSPQQARAYVTTVRTGAEPPEEPANLTRRVRTSPPLPVETLTGPVL
ncbi:hypothetical protein [Kitasatospora sp. NBC_01539]|uniref:hypothetical protein n=1 Tax=Kitasatospora sp. NBC_01539 TaxID=2903577 RepID=UPI0038603118